MKIRTCLVALALAAVAFVPSVPAQTVTFDLGLGYQWLDVSGNEDVFRTQVKEKDGFLLDTLTLQMADKDGGMFDLLRVDAAGIGASPDTRFRVQADRAGTYSLRLSYTRSDVYFALPGYANPLAAGGAVVGQHTIDRRRDTVDLDLTLFPNATFSPLVGFSRYHYQGPGTTTYFFGQDEFALANDLDEKLNEYRLGFTLTVGDWRATVMQGWRSSDTSYDYALASSPSGGNNSSPVLGRNILAATLAGHSHSSVSSAPFTNAVVAGTIASRVRFSGSYVRADGMDLETDETFSATGQFASFALQRFFKGAMDTAYGKAESDGWRGNARVEVEITPWLDVIGGFTSSHRSLTGSGLLYTAYLDTVNFSNADPKTVAALIGAETAWERDEDYAEGKIVARPTSWLSLWAGGGSLDQEVTITPAAAEIVVPGGQGGTFSRSIDRIAAGADAVVGPVTLGVDWQTDDANRAVVRSDYLDRDRLRARATVKIGSMLRVTGSGEWIDLKNPDPGIAYDAEIEHYGAAVEVMPIAALTIHAGYDSYTSDSTVLFRTPQDFTTGPSIYAEDGESIDGGVALQLGRIRLDAGASRYENKGDMAFDLDRTYARFDVGVTETIGVYGQYESREYKEKALPIADYSADRYGLFLRWASK